MNLDVGLDAVAGKNGKVAMFKAAKWVKPGLEGKK